MQYAFKRMATNRGITAIVDVFEFNGGFAGTVQDGVLHVTAQFVKRRFHVEIIMLTERAQHLEIIEVTTIPAADSPTRQRKLRVLHHTIRVEELLHTQPVTGRTGSRRVVEREHTRFKLAHAVAAHRTGKVGREQHFFGFRVIHIGDHGGTAGKLKRGFKRFRQALRQIVTHFKAVNDHFNGVFLLQF
ncbi:hypothetical protein SRABI106_03781 [Rahnella aquatilis]|nr:hypothetical protein SRABI106_03781 [Rahnella aquatilis]